MFGPRKSENPAEVIPPLPTAPRDWSAAQVHDLQRAMVEALRRGASLETLIGMVDGMPPTPRNMFELIALFGGELADMGKLRGTADAYLAKPQPTEPVLIFERLVVEAFLTEGRDSGRFAAREVAKPHPSGPVDQTNPIAAQLVIHFVSESWQEMQ